MKITVKATVTEDDGSTFEADIDLDWEEMRLNRETGARHVYGSGDAWVAILPPRPATQHKGEARRSDNKGKGNG